MALTKAQLIDLNGNELILDLDADTSITADTDDQIDIKIAGADDFRFTANTFTALSGSTIVVPDSGLTLGSTAVTSTAAELNLLDGVSGLVQADLTKLAALDATAAELNFTDGGSTIGTTAVADGDGIIHNDGGTMKVTTAATFKTYFQEGISTAFDDLTAGDAAVLISTSSGNITIDATASDSDIILKGTDGGADTTFLTIDGSAAGEATFNAGIVIADAGVIGSASDKDAIAIGSDGDVTLTQDLELQHDGAILSFGANDEVSLTHVHDTGILLNSTNVIQFNDASQNIGAPSNAILDINATDEIELNATEVEINVTTLDVNGNLDVSGTIVGASTLSATTGTFSGILKTDDATDATSTTDGSLQTDGGLSVAKDTIIGNDLKLLSDSAVLVFGAGSDATLTHTNDTGLTLNSTNKLMFNDASQFIQGTSATVLSIGATDEIDLTATAVDLNGTLNVSGVATFQAAPVFPDGSLAVADLDIDGATDIGAAIVDADLFIVDDGAGGTNRKVTASRLKTYAGFDTDAAVVFNESSNDVDFRVESNGDANCLFVNGGDDEVGIGINDPDGKLHILGAGGTAGSISAVASANTLVLEDNSSVGISLLGGNEEECKIVFGDDGDADIGGIVYHNNTNDMNFITNTAVGMEIHSNGAVTKPLQPAFKVTQTSALSVAEGHTLFSSNTTEVKDLNADFASGTFTAPVDGFYYISASILYESLGSGDTDTIEDTFVFSNGNEIISRAGKLNTALSSGGFYMSNNATIAFMDANDTVSCRHSDGGTLATHPNAPATHFEGYLLG